MNRYTQLTPAQFDPLSLQEIMMVPLARQQQHDTQQAQIADMGIQLNALQADTPYYESQVKDFRNRADSLTDELMSKGVGRGLTKNLMSLSRDRRNFLEGDGAKIQGAYDAYQANVKHIMDIPEKEMSMADKQIYLNYAANQYNQSGGVKAGASYNPYYGANTQDVNAIASEYASKMTPQEIEKETGWRLIQRDGQTIWSNGNRTTKTLPYNEIATAVMNRLQGDRGVMSYMQALSQSTGQDYSSLMSQAALNAARQYQMNDSSITEDMRNFTENKDDVTTNNDNMINYNYVMPPSSQHANKISQENYLQTVNEILDPNFKSDERLKVDVKSFNPLSPGSSLKKDSNSGKARTISDLPQSVQDRYKEIAEGLKKKGLIVDDDINNKSTLKEVAEYDKKYGESITRIGIVPDFVGAVGKYSTGINSKDYTSVLKAVQSTQHRATYKHPQTGKNYTWDELKDEFNITNVSAIEGYVDSDNGLPDTDNPTSDIKSEWVSPQVVTLIDKNGNTIEGFYKTRDDGELNTPRYKEDVSLNRNVFTKVKNNPLLPQTVNYLGQEVEMAYYPEKEGFDILNQISENLKNKELTEENKGEVLMYERMREALSKAGGRQGIYEIKGKDGTTAYYTKEEIQSFAYNKKGIDY